MPSTTRLNKALTAGILSTIVGASFYNVMRVMNRDPLADGLDELDKMDKMQTAPIKKR